MRRIFSRTLTVDYYRMTDSRWHVKSQVVDNFHNIAVHFDVSLPDLVVGDCSVDFLRQPYMGCNRIESALEGMDGSSIRRDFKSRAFELMIGPKGCGNIYCLLTCAGSAFRWLCLWGGTIQRLLSAEQKRAYLEELRGECLARAGEPRPITPPSSTRDFRDKPAPNDQ